MHQINKYAPLSDDASLRRIKKADVVCPFAKDVSFFGCTSMEQGVTV